MDETPERQGTPTARNSTKTRGPRPHRAPRELEHALIVYPKKSPIPQSISLQEGSAPRNRVVRNGLPAYKSKSFGEKPSPRFEIRSGENDPSSPKTGREKFMKSVMVS